MRICQDLQMLKFKIPRQARDCAPRFAAGLNYARTPDQIMEDMNGRTDSGVSLQGVTASGKGALIDLKMDEGTGTTTKDSSGNSKTGTLNDGAAWSQSGKYNKGITLDGSNDDVSVADFAY